MSVEHKLNSQMVYTPEQLQQGQFSVGIIDDGKTAQPLRCSFETVASKVTCDTYNADRVETDKSIGLKKFYHFPGQFDLQLILKELSFVEMAVAALPLVIVY